MRLVTISAVAVAVMCAALFVFAPQRGLAGSSEALRNYQLRAGDSVGVRTAQAGCLVRRGMISCASYRPKQNYTVTITTSGIIVLNGRRQEYVHLFP